MARKSKTEKTKTKRPAPSKKTKTPAKKKVKKEKQTECVVPTSQEGLGPEASPLEVARISAHKNPTEENYRQLAGEALNEGRLLEAYIAYENVLKLNPKCPESLTSVGMILFESGLYNEVVAIMKKSESTLNELTADMYYYWGLALEMLDQHDAAIKLFERGIAVHAEESGKYYRRIGVIYERQEHYNHALTNFRKAMALNARDQEAFFFAGICYMKKNQYNDAIEKFQQTIQIDPVTDFALESKKQMTNAMLLNNQTSDALRELSMLAIIFPHDIMVLANFAKSLLAEMEKNNITDKTEELFGVLARILELDPEYKPAKDMLAYLYSKSFAKT